ncbi:MAG: hypothetical protein EOP84_08290 [Verrucomicrobiaceae bacterium]|nr:MAG: hypothetical protein EOP84_08290 [Verrucomicrobiaceae bacterium]
MIRRITAIVLLLCTAFPISAAELEAAERKELISRATTMLDGFRKGETEIIIRMTHPAIYGLTGGKEAFERMAHDAMTSIAGAGLKIEETRIGNPSRTWQAGKETVCFVPVSIVFSMTDKKIRSNSYYVAVKGETSPDWLFLDGSGFDKKPEVLKQILPGLPIDIEFPKIYQETVE